MTGGAQSSAPSAPKVAVVVATYDRPSLLAELVSSLLAQDHPSFEVIVVDDASPGTTMGVLDDLAARDGRGILRVCRLDRNSGAATARNLGWRSSTADVVLFIDDDCRAKPGWVRELSAAVEHGWDVAQGRTEPDHRDEAPMGPWDRTINVRRWSGLFEGCNMGYHRSILERVGGFDERFRAGEDTDLGLRAVAAGARTGFVESAVVEHTVWRLSFRRHLRDRLRSVHLVRLVKLHPQLRATLPLRIFWQRSHALTSVGLVLCTAAGVVDLRLLPAAIAAWILLASRPIAGPLRQRIRVGSLRVVAGVAEVAAMGMMSVRQRSLLL